MTMGAIDFSTLGLVIAVVTGIGSFLLGRHLRKGRQAKKQAKERAALPARCGARASAPSASEAAAPPQRCGNSLTRHRRGAWQ